MRFKVEKLREYLRVSEKSDFADERIAKIIDVSPNTARSYGKLKSKHELTWDESELLSDTELLEQCEIKLTRKRRRVTPDFAHYVQLQTADKRVTNQICWEHYRLEAGENGYGKSRFNDLFKEYRRSIKVSARLSHFPGDAMEVDYAGKLITYRPLPDITKKAQLLVVVLVYSKKIFVWASETQSTADFIDGQVRALEYFGGVPEAIVSDNLKAAVIRAGRNPDFNKAYMEFASHYCCELISTRVRAPQDKADAEQAVRFVTNNITAKLQGEDFESIAQINERIAQLLPDLNDRPFSEREGSRNTWFEAYEKSALRPLPEKAYEYGEWLPERKVDKTYHIAVCKHHYSVPHELAGKRVKVRLTARRVDVYYDHKQVASHTRSSVAGGTTTDKAHMTAEHAYHASQDRQMYLAWAKAYGPKTVAIVEAQYEGTHDQSRAANSACERFKGHAKSYDPEAVEAACARASKLTTTSISAVNSILTSGSYKYEDSDFVQQSSLPFHENIRGPQFFGAEG